MGPKKVMRIVVDTHVVMAALLFGGTPAKLIPLWKAGSIKPFASKEIIAEFLQVMAYPKFNLNEEEIEYLLYQELLPCFEVTQTGPLKEASSDGLSDDKFIRCARAAGAQPIISGDRRLLSMKPADSIQILTPAQFLEKTLKFSSEKTISEKTDS